VTTVAAEETRIRRLLAAALIFVLGFQVMRFLFASLTWYLRDTLGIGVLDLIPISLAPFLLAAVLPLASKYLGVRRAVFVGAGLLVLARIANQVSIDPGIEFWAAAVGTLAFVGLVPLLYRLGRDLIVGGLLLGLVIDSSIKGLGLSLDLAYQPGWRSVAAVIGLCLGLLWAVQGVGESRETGTGWARGALLLAIGPFLFFELLILQSQGWISAVTGVPGEIAQLGVALLNVLGLILVSRFRATRALYVVAALVVVSAAISAEGESAVFGALVIFAIPLSFFLWDGLVPGEDGEKSSSSTFYLLTGITLFLVLGLAYYLPLDMNLGFSQAAVRLGASLILLVAGLLALSSRQVVGSVWGRHDWLLGGVAAMLPIVGYLATLGSVSVASPESTGPIRFMSYNVHSAFNTAGSLDVEAIARVIEDTNASVVGIQEIPRGRLLSGTTDLLTLLRLRLGFEHVAFFGTTDPVWGNAIFSRYPIIEVGSDYLPLVGTPMRRGVLGATIDTGSGEVLVISTHLQHVNDSAVHDDDPEADLLPVHSEQIDTILRHWTGRDPAVLMGDFNARPEWAQIQKILDAGWVDSWAEAGVGDGLTSGAVNPQYRIDYVFHTGSLRAVDAGVIISLASDHFPVVVDLVRE